jgi:TPR repeat protein
MSKLLLGLICGLVGWGAAAAQPDGGGYEDPMSRERKHFLESLSYVYSPQFWISYNAGLYFAVFTEQQAQQLDTLKLARSQYASLTDPRRRHELAAHGIAASGVDESWRRKLLLEYSDANQNLTPTLGKRVMILPAYRILQRLGNGDALLQDLAGTVFFAMNHGRAADDAGCTNGLFVKEGEKTYTTKSGTQNTVEAYASVGLSAAERLVLQRVSSEFRKEAAAIQKPAVIAAQDRSEFELLKTRATDSNPYMQFLVAKAYLEGKGTPKDEQLGLEWMRRAQSNGSGDAKSYIDARSK